MAVKLLVFQHAFWEGPGEFLLNAAKKHKTTLDVVHLWDGQEIPELEAYNGLLVLGGGPNVDQEDEYPFLVEEKKAIRDALERDMPYLGICLGHQLLADAIGEKVAENFISSIGFIKGHLTHEGRIHPIFEGIDIMLPLFKWHGQAVQTPLATKTSILATSEECHVEAISIPGRPHIVGFQFDNHAAYYDDVSVWLENDRQWVFTLPDRVINPMVILSFARKNAERIKADFEVMFANFIKLVKSH